MLEALADLLEDFGFDEPQDERLGRETFARYHKASRTVSIASEPGCMQNVELFYPSEETGEAPTQWAE